MRISIGFVIVICCLTGCSEMRVIGSAAMRELRADAVSVNWSAAEPDKKASAERSKDQKIYVAAKAKTFSSIRRGPTDRKKPVKGLWEQHGS